MTRRYDRRDALKAIGTAIATTVPLAGCSGPSGGTTPTPTPEPTPTPTEASDDEWTETSTVDMNDELAFAPKRIQVSAGTTVTWENVGTIGHTVTAYDDGIPEGAEYFASGGFDSESAAKDGYPEEGNIPEGESYEHTFETKGQYKYYCIPHEMNGMIGYVKVT